MNILGYSFLSKKFIQIYLDIYSCHFLDTNIFGYSFVSISIRMSHSALNGDNAGRCMHNLGVVAGDSRDNLGQKRFFPFVAETHLEGAYSFDDDDDDDNM